MAEHTGEMGRPTKRTEAARAAIMLALEKGMTRKGAAAACGMHYDTLRVWIDADPDFSADVTRAEEAAEAHYVEVIEKAATIGKVTRRYARDGSLDQETIEYDWRAAAWMLERRHNANYGNRDKVELTSVPPLVPTTLDDHERAVLGEVIREAIAHQEAMEAEHPDAVTSAHDVPSGEPA